MERFDFIAKAREFLRRRRPIVERPKYIGRNSWQERSWVSPWSNVAHRLRPSARRPFLADSFVNRRVCPAGLDPVQGKLTGGANLRMSSITQGGFGRATDIMRRSQPKGKSDFDSSLGRSDQSRHWQDRRHQRTSGQEPFAEGHLTNLESGLG
jgi:hypothetical protein